MVIIIVLIPENAGFTVVLGLFRLRQAGISAGKTRGGQKKEPGFSQLLLLQKRF